MASPQTLTDPPDALASIPDPLHVRWVIAMRHAEILVLRKLLRAAESRSRLFPSDATQSDRSPEVSRA